MNALERICADKRRHIEERQTRKSFAALISEAEKTPRPRHFADRLEKVAESGKFALICEMKRASPSGGVIRPDFDAGKLARDYEKGGAACLSVLTDEPHFQGRDEDLKSAHKACGLPVLRKDFMLDPYQIMESRVLGADCVLLIMAALDDDTAADLETLALDNGMDVLVEVHDGQELARALKLRSRLIGINNRDLKTLKTDLATTERLARDVPDDRILVSESGIRTHEDIVRLAEAGADGFLIGESLMREADVTAATRALLLGSDAKAQA